MKHEIRGLTCKKEFLYVKLVIREFILNNLPQNADIYLLIMHDATIPRNKLWPVVWGRGVISIFFINFSERNGV